MGHVEDPGDHDTSGHVEPASEFPFADIACMDRACRFEAIEGFSFIGVCICAGGSLAC